MELPAARTAQWHGALADTVRAGVSTPALIKVWTIWLALAVLLAGNTAGVASTTENHAPGSSAQRSLYDGDDSPPWLLAVGRLQVPGIRYRDGRRRHYLEDCSGTLVGTPGAVFVLTAWHCFADYRDLSQRILFTLGDHEAGSLTSEAVKVADGGGMHADWALLRLTDPGVSALARPLRLSPTRGDPTRTIVMAGDSREPARASDQRRLSYDPACRITAQRKATTESDCSARKGASGGAVVQSLPGAEPVLLGVISEGDGNGISIYVPTAVFLGQVKSHLGR